VRVLLFDVNLDAAAFGREFHRVREQIPHDLLDAFGVGYDHFIRYRVRNFDRNLPGIRGRADVLDGVIYDVHQAKGLDVEAELTRDDPRHIKQVLDQLHLRASISLDGLEGLVTTFRGEI